MLPINFTLLSTLMMATYRVPYRVVTLSVVVFMTVLTVLRTNKAVFQDVKELVYGSQHTSLCKCQLGWLKTLFQQCTALYGPLKTDRGICFVFCFLIVQYLT